MTLLALLHALGRRTPVVFVALLAAAPIVATVGGHHFAVVVIDIAALAVAVYGLGYTVRGTRR